MLGREELAVYLKPSLGTGIRKLEIRRRDGIAA